MKRAEQNNYKIFQISREICFILDIVENLIARCKILGKFYNSNEAANQNN